MAFRVESRSCTYFNHHAFFGAWTKFCHQKSCSEIFHFLRNPLTPPAQLIPWSHVIPASPAPACHIPASLAPAATAAKLLCRNVQLCHTCIPSSPKFSAVDSRPEELWHQLPRLPMPQLSQCSAVPDLPAPRSCITAESPNHAPGVTKPHSQSHEGNSVGLWSLSALMPCVPRAPFGTAWHPPFNCT